MKNIHVLLTDKPSRLYSKDGNHILDTTMAIDWYISSAGYKPQNIFITSDEEIKDGDWGYNTYTKSVHTIDIVGTKNNQWKKIILTTDQDLIKDGVQAIDDEFLEWFVKNPSCEEVKVVLNEVSYFIEDNIHIIAIPKEEQKQHLIDMMKADEELGLYKEPKQETLEEAAEKYAKQFDYAEDSSPYIDFIEGAEWQMERSYSEEEVLDLLKKFYQDDNNFNGTIEEWFEQFKKK